MAARVRIIGGPKLGDPAEAVAIVGDGEDQLAFVDAEEAAAERRALFPDGGDAVLGTWAHTHLARGRLLHRLFGRSDR